MNQVIYWVNDIWSKKYYNGIGTKKIYFFISLVIKLGEDIVSSYDLSRPTAKLHTHDQFKEYVINMQKVYREFQGIKLKDHVLTIGMNCPIFKR